LSQGGYTDWFLPSQAELGLIWANLRTQGIGTFGNWGYWSSSENGASFAYYLDFNYGYGSYASKGYSGLGVRAIRAF
jgi:hypothetical protein